MSVFSRYSKLIGGGCRGECCWYLPCIPINKKIYL